MRAASLMARIHCHPCEGECYHEQSGSRLRAVRLWAADSIVLDPWAGRGGGGSGHYCRKPRSGSDERHRFTSFLCRPSTVRCVRSCCVLVGGAIGKQKRRTPPRPSPQRAASCASQWRPSMIILTRFWHFWGGLHGRASRRLPNCAGASAARVVLPAL
ncbi:hypothetical protein MRX96_011734 [Rhipicephalus microplus]